MKQYILYHGDCLDKLKLIPDNSIHSIVTDPPYGISFMNNAWDYDIPSVAIWKECLRVLKPGGHLLSFASSRTYHRIATTIEDAGFEIRDQFMWLYGSGFPKSTNISKLIDKKYSAKRTVIGKRKHPTLKDSKKINRQDSHQFHGSNCIKDEWEITEPCTEEAKYWDGWGSALKPSHEPIVMARKPFDGGLVDNVLKHGTGALNIDACRIKSTHSSHEPSVQSEGRFPANLTLSHHKYCVPVSTITTKSKQLTAGRRNVEEKKGWGVGQGGDTYIKGTGAQYEGDGTDTIVEYACHKDCAIRKLEDYNNQASKFFYCPKVKRRERNEGLQHLDTVDVTYSGNVIGLKNNINTSSGKTRNPNTLTKNNHPTVKPITLMQYLCKLTTQHNQIVLDPFMGSGTTGIAAIKEGFRFVGIEREENYYVIAQARLKHFNKKLFD